MLVSLRAERNAEGERAAALETAVQELQQRTNAAEATAAQQATALDAAKAAAVQHKDDVDLLERDKANLENLVAALQDELRRYAAAVQSAKASEAAAKVAASTGATLVAPDSSSEDGIMLMKTGVLEELQQVRVSVPRGCRGP